jgi:hypothetical protein
LVVEEHDLMQSDIRLTVIEMAEEVGISYGLCQATLTKEFSLSHDHSVTADTEAETKPLVCGF